jgi:hypothetical protein
MRARDTRYRTNRLTPCMCGHCMHSVQVVAVVERVYTHYKTRSTAVDLLVCTGQNDVFYYDRHANP